MSQNQVCRRFCLSFGPGKHNLPSQMLVWVGEGCTKMQQ
uniref:Uncharacterized protein n=1 Tax=Anguilla anguilla TaxID=7936 RepID=A0A0E9WB34_ANGAN